MKQQITAMLALSVLSATLHAECEPPGRPLTIELTPAQVEARYKDYQRMCELYGGTLVDGQATHLGERFVRPSDAYMLVPKNERQRFPPPIKGTTFIGAVVNDKGKTVEVSLISSSGDEASDRQVIETARRFHYAKPAKLDKEPVQFYESFLISPVKPKS